MTVTLGDALARATARLAEAGIESARLEAELLLSKACDDCARALLYAELDRELNDEQEAAFERQVARREKREPLAYVLGEWGFRRLTLKTDRRALIPRPETEVVVERALEHIRGLDEPDVLDVGTGTGAIALAIADEDPDARVTAIDASTDALALARENLDLTGINGRVRLVEHDLTSGLGDAQYDLVVSNPPYVEPGELETLQPEVRDWEPHIALVASGATEAVARAATEALRPGGWLVLETAADRRRAGRAAARRARIRAGYDHARSGREGPGGRGTMEGLTTRDGRRLAYRRAGSGPLLVCHGGGPGFSSLYLGELAGLGDELELVLLDPRGTGDSTKPSDSRAYAIEDYVSDLEELREHLGLERMQLFGHSHGGIVAMAYAARHPERVERLILASTLARFSPEAEAAMAAAVESHADEPWYEDARAALEAESAGDFETDEELAGLTLREFPFYFARYGDDERAYLDEPELGAAERGRAPLFNKEQVPDLRPAARAGADRRRRRS